MCHYEAAAQPRQSRSLKSLLRMGLLRMGIDKAYHLCYGKPKQSLSILEIILVPCLLS
jgi:hypothetical protein